MNKGKARRLRKELEREQNKADRGHQATTRLLREKQRRQALELVAAGALTLKQLSAVQRAVHFDEAK